MEVVIDKIILKSKAHQKPFTKKPSINLLASKIIPALITSKNNPRVKMVKGMVNKTKTGFKNVFRKANTIAISKALVKLVTSIPDNNQSVKKTASPDMSSFNNICPIEFCFIMMQSKAI